jgi:hypothetical protein
MIRVEYNKDFIDCLIDISSRMSLEPIRYDREDVWSWYRYRFGSYFNDQGEEIFWFDHPVEPEYALNDTGRSGKHTFKNYQQCLQSLVQHRTFDLVKDIYDQKENS